MNRSFKYGDGLFETMRWHNGYIPRLNLHFDRLHKGLQTLGIQAPFGFNAQMLYQWIKTEIDKKMQNANALNWRIRITCFRGGGGLYSPAEHTMQWTIELEPLAAEGFQLPQKGITLGLCPNIRLSCDILAPLKTTSALPYVMAARYRQTQPALDDCILLNSKAQVAETIAANLFYRKDTQLFTPSLKEGCVAGTLRRWIIERASIWQLQLQETSIALSELYHADEIFLCNAIQGLRWVHQLKLQDQNYSIPSKQLSQQITAALNLDLEKNKIF